MWKRKNKEHRKKTKWQNNEIKGPEEKRKKFRKIHVNKIDNAWGKIQEKERFHERSNQESKKENSLIDFYPYVVK